MKKKLFSKSMAWILSVVMILGICYIPAEQFIGATVSVSAKSEYIYDNNGNILLYPGQTITTYGSYAYSNITASFWEVTSGSAIRVINKSDSSCEVEAVSLGDATLKATIYSEKTIIVPGYYMLGSWIPGYSYVDAQKNETVRKFRVVDYDTIESYYYDDDNPKPEPVKPKFEYNTSFRDEGEAWLEKYNGNEENVIIPNEIKNDEYEYIEPEFDIYEDEDGEIYEDIWQEAEELNGPYMLSVTRICDHAFLNCNNLVSVEIPNSVYEIEDEAFKGCTNLQIIRGKYGSAAYDYVYNNPYVVIKYSDEGYPIGTRNLIFEDINTGETYNFDDEDEIEFVNISEISAEKIMLGEQITITAKASEGAGPYKFDVCYKKTDDTNWITKQENSLNRTVTIEPTECGIYDVCVKAYDANKKIAEKCFQFKAIGEIKNTSVISYNPKNSYLTVNCSATGGTGDYTYAVYYKLSTSKYYTPVQDYSSTSTIKITPSKPGTYNIRTRVKDSTGTMANQDFTVTVVDPALKNTSTISSAESIAGGSVTVTASGTGGTAPYTYAVYYKLSTSKYYTTLQDYSTTNTVTVTTAKEGIYNIRVRVKDSTGAMANNDFDVIVSTAPLSNNSTISTTSIAAGGSVTVTGKASGGTSPYQYALYYKKSTASYYSTASNYSATRAMTLTLQDAGTYNIRTRVKDSKGNLATKDFNVTVSVANDSTISSDSVTLGDDLTITCKASGVNSGCTYAVYCKKSTAKYYSTLQAFSTNNEVKFTPQAAAEYNIRTKVRDSSGNIVTKDFTVKVANAASLVNLSTLSSAAVSKDSSVSVNANAACGTTPYLYAVYMKNSTAKYYSTKQDFSTNSTIDVTPASTGTYDIRVKVKDKTGKIVVKDFTLKVT